MNSAQFNADGTRIVTASVDKTAQVWDVTNCKPLGQPLRHEDFVFTAQFSPDGTRIVTASEDHTARVWDAASGKPLGEPLRHDASVFTAQFSPDGTRIVTTNSDNTARVWDAVSGEQIAQPLRHEDFVKSAQFSADGNWIVTASEDKTARVWDADSGEPIGEPLHHEYGLRSAQFNADGTRIITASMDNTARVWDAATDQILGEPLRHEDFVYSAQMSSDGTRIVTASNDMTARVWDVASGEPIGEPLRHKDIVFSAQFSADRTRIVTASADKTARVWDAASGKPVGQPLCHENIVWSAQFSPDGARIVTASFDNTARVWDAASGKQVGQPLCHEKIVWSAQFSPDGMRIVTASSDLPDGIGIVTEIRDFYSKNGEARVWDAVSSKPLGEPLRHAEVVNTAQFSPDGTRIVTASADKTARVWDAVSGKPLGEPLRHEGFVLSAQFSVDGTHIVTASTDKTARVWEAHQMLHPPAPVLEWMIQRAWAIAGLDFDTDGQMKGIPDEQRLMILCQRSPDNDPWTKFALWMVQPRNLRTLTPESNFTCRQIAERERDSETKEGIESALRYDPTVPLAHLLLAEYEDDSRRAAFLRDYELKRLPMDAVLWSRASEILLNQEQADMALEAARKAVALDAKQIAAQRALAYALDKAEQKTEALNTWDKVLADKETSFNDFCDAGYLAAELNQGDKARSIFREGEKRFPASPDILQFKGQALLLLHAAAEALAALQAYEPMLAAYDGSKPQPDAIAILTVSRWLTGDKDGAVADYQRLIDMQHEYTDVDYLDIDSVTESGWDDAIKEPLLKVLAETLKRHPDLVPKKKLPVLTYPPPRRSTCTRRRPRSHAQGSCSVLSTPDFPTTEKGEAGQTKAAVH